MRRGDRVVVVSEGFGFFVEDQLRRAGLQELDWSANRLRFEGARAVPEFPLAYAGCGQGGGRSFSARGRKMSNKTNNGTSMVNKVISGRTVTLPKQPQEASPANHFSAVTAMKPAKARTAMSQAAFRKSCETSQIPRPISSGI